MLLLFVFGESINEKPKIKNEESKKKRCYCFLSCEEFFEQCLRCPFFIIKRLKENFWFDFIWLWLFESVDWFFIYGILRNDYPRNSNKNSQSIWARRKNIPVERNNGSLQNSSLWSNESTNPTFSCVSILD